MDEVLPVLYNIYYTNYNNSSLPNKGLWVIGVVRFSFPTAKRHFVSPLPSPLNINPLFIVLTKGKRKRRKLIIRRKTKGFRRKKTKGFDGK